MRRLSAIAALCLAVALCASAQVRIVVREGGVKGNRYNNPSLGVSYEFPQGWQAETPALPPKLTAAPVTLLKAHPSARADHSWIAIQVTALSKLPEERREPRSFVQSEVQAWKVANGSAEIVGPVQSAELGSHDFARADVVMKAGEQDDPMVLFAGAVNGMMFLLQVHSLDKAELNDLADTSDSLRFYPPEGTEDAPPMIPTPSPEDHSAVKRISVPETAMRARLISKVDPEYPAEARERRVEGEVLLEVVVGRDGSVVEANVVSGHPLLTDAALAAVKQWKFEPYLIDGRAVETQTKIRVTFSLISAKTSS